MSRDTPWSSRTAEPVQEHWLRDRLLAVRRVAEGGSPAVLIHGLGGNSLNWTDLGFAFSGRLDSWAVDLPGFGHSPPPRDGDYSPTGYARAVLDLIDEEIGAPVHVFGNSMGGAIAVQLAARYPDRVRSLTLISPALPGGRPTRSNVYLPAVAVPGLGERMVERFMRNPPQSRARATIRTTFADPDRLPELRWREAVTEVTRRDQVPYAADAFTQATRGLMRSLLDRGQERPLELARRVRVPCLLIYGRQDRLVTSDGAYHVGNAIPDSRVVGLADCGHVAQMEHPERVHELWVGLMDGRVPWDEADDQVAHRFGWDE